MATPADILNVSSDATAYDTTRFVSEVESQMTGAFNSELFLNTEKPDIG